MRRTIRVAFLTLLLSSLALSGCFLVKLNVAAAVGNWSGNWNNTTFSSTGTATMTVSQNTSAKTATLVLDLNGNVFGAGDPAAQTMTGTYTDTTLSVNTTTPLFNAIALTVNAMGDVSGTAHPTGFDHLTFSGTQSASKVSLTYKIYDTPTHIYANGTVVMNKM